jgi:hypothetical protein
MLNLQLQPVLRPNPGELICRGIFQVLGTNPLPGVDPSEALVNPDVHARHTTRRLRVPIGGHTTPGYMFTPKEYGGATVMLVHGTTAEKILPYYFYIRALLRAATAWRTTCPPRWSTSRASPAWTWAAWA